MAKYIVITKSSSPSYWYADKIGEVFEVVDEQFGKYNVKHDGTVGKFYVDRDDCKEIESVLDLIANLSRRVSELERTVKRLGIEKAAEEIDKAVVKKRQLTRDEIVRRAIEDVAELERWFLPSYTYVDFVLNRDKRTVVALIRGKNTGGVFDRGIAKCAPGDVFNAHIGKAIALRRAFGLEVPAEYLNAPQPKKPRVGDVVQAYGYGGNPLPLVVVDAIEKRSGEIRIKRDKHKERYIPFEPECGDYIFDDTESTERAAKEAADNVRD